MNTYESDLEHLHYLNKSISELIQRLLTPTISNVERKILFLELDDYLKRRRMIQYGQMS